MGKKQRKWIILLASLALITFLIPVLTPLFTARADTIGALEAKLKEAEAARAAAESGLSGVQAEMTDVKARRAALDKEISVLEQEIHAISLEIEENEKGLRQIEEELQNAQDEADEYKAIFQERVRIMYERGSLSVLTVLFSADSFSDLLKRAELISQIAAYDDAVMDRMEEAQAEIAMKKTALEETNAIAELNRDIQAAKKAELDAKKASLDSAMSALQSDEDAYRAALDEADEAEAALRAEIKALTTPGTAQKPTENTPPPYSGGKFCWPTPSTTYITSPFGTRYHPIQKRNKTHTGIDIGAGHGASILAAEAGTVLRADWNSGYGNYVVIDHGGGVQTLYGHCSALLVKSGQTVSRGQQIALVGSTGVSTGPHLHFEVLINGSYTDPMAYFE